MNRTINNNLSLVKTITYYLFDTWKKIDKKLLAVILGLIFFGWLILYSASYSTEGDTTVTKQFIFIILGLIIMTAAAFMPVKFYSGGFLPVVASGVGIVLMVVCILININKQIKRYINLTKYVSIEPSEILKFALILITAFLAVKYYDKLHSSGYLTPYYEKLKYKAPPKNKAVGVYRAIINFLSKIFIESHYVDTSIASHLILAFPIGIMIVLIVISKHLSATIIVGATALYMLINVAKPKYFVPAVFAGFLGVALYTLIQNGFQLQRVVVMTFSPEGDDQQKNALYAIASGGLFGKGFTYSAEKFGFVPEQKNDFIFSIYCEETGVIGAILMLMAFGYLVYKIYRTGQKHQNEMIGLGVCSVAVTISLQVIIHILVNIKLLPNTGITLPFFSYGGSAFIIICAEMGYVLAASTGVSKQEA